MGQRTVMGGIRAGSMKNMCQKKYQKNLYLESLQVRRVSGTEQNFICRLPKVIIKNQNFENILSFSVQISKQQLFPISNTVEV